MHKLPSGIYVAPEKGKIVIPTYEPETFAQLPMTEIRTLDNGVSTAVLPLHDDTVRLLSNMDINIAGLEPMRYYYQMPLVEGKYPLYEHQIQSAGYLVAHKRGFNLSTMRVGKTASAIIGADYVQKRLNGHAILVLSTATTLNTVWEKEIRGLLPNARVQVLTGSKDQRVDKLNSLADYYIINFDGVKVIFKELLKAFEDGKFSVVIIDELSHYSNHKSDLWKSLNAVINNRKNPAEYVWGLTGTPGKDPEPVYAQVKLVCPDRINMSFYQWKNMTMINTWGFKWVMRKEAPAMIEKVMQPTIRFNKDDLFDIPKPTREFVFSALTDEQKRIVEDLKQDSMALLKGEGGQPVAAVADNRAVAVSKMLQACVGAMRVDEDRVVRINMDSRLEDLRKIIDSSERKVIIFCAFKETIAVLGEWCKEKIGYSESHGGVTGKARSKEFKKFQDPESGVKVLLAHPRTTAFGTELSIADTMVFFGPPMSGYMAFAQAVERMSSLKQEATSLKIIYFYGTAEEKIAFESAEKGRKTGQLLTNYLKRWYMSTKLVFFSGGMGSFATTLRVFDEDTHLLFTDTLIEHKSLYKFLVQSFEYLFKKPLEYAHYLVDNIPEVYEDFPKRKRVLLVLQNYINCMLPRVHWIRYEVEGEGVSVWDIFYNDRFIGNSRVANCSKIIKQRLARNYVRSTFKDGDYSVYLGIDWSESHRTKAPTENWGKYAKSVEFPLLDPPYIDKKDKIR